MCYFPKNNDNGSVEQGHKFVISFCMIFQHPRIPFFLTKQYTKRRSLGSIPQSPTHSPGFILYDDLTDITLPLPPRTLLKEGMEKRDDSTPEILKPFFKSRLDDPSNTSRKSSFLKAVRRPEDIGNLSTHLHLYFMYLIII
jgi:hypothetical protein